jgi:hypothetical protein
MNSRDLLFNTARFNLSVVGEHFINPCCFGEDLAAWLRGKLADKGIPASAPGQEDWGWYLSANYAQRSYFLGMNGNPDVKGSDEGEWRIIVEKKRPLWEVVTRGGKIADDDPMLKILEQIVHETADFTNVHFEVQAQLFREW